MSFNVEKGLISKLLQTKDFSAVKDAQIKENYLTGEHKNAFLFIVDVFKTSGEVPTERVFRKRFPNYSLDTLEDDSGEEVVGTEENIKYWCEEVRKKARHNQIAESVEGISGLLQKFSTEDAYQKIKSTIALIEGEYTETMDIDITQGAEERIAAYKERKINRGMRGLATGFNHLDSILKGLEKSTLTTLIAQTGIGKTWFEVIVGSYCMLNSCRVLQFVTEMSEEVMRDRYEAALYAKCCGEFNYSFFKSGTLDPQTESKYFDFLRNDLPHLEPLYIVTATSPLGVAASIDKYKPDIVLIDSTYLMEDDQSAKDDWLRVAHITRDLKKLAKATKVPILINTQADKNTSKKTGPELESIMYTQAIGQDSDNVLALFRDEVMFNDREMGIKVLKQREGTLGKSIVSWNFDTMDFTDIYVEREEDKRVLDTTIQIDE